ncbi:rho GTPase-activating protein 32 [Chanos chanos]|uniref:Rho GTPase-activating protein 32 n=1 Tax=Chanos chanos TaxID=29144 RepID=A0A6J2VLB1_CHACN|nr:rho GTPase-activating protein 32-like [Chanos chanos]
MEAGSGAAATTLSSAPAPQGDAHRHDTLGGAASSPYPHPEDEDQSIAPADRAGWEDAIALMARSADTPEQPAPESSLRSCVSTASMKVKNVKKLSFSKGHFPRLAECAHFHYENVDFGSVQLSLAEDQGDVTRNGLESKELVYLVQISCQGRKWIVRRSYEDFRVLDKHLHLCIYDRRFSNLTELPRFDSVRDKTETLFQMLTAYLSRLSAIADNKINCGPALTWMEIDNKGNHLLVHDESSINVPAIAAAHVIKRYIAQAADELSFEVGDIVSVIDMPPKEDTGWWRGKHGFQVGFFPCECVELISEKISPCVTSSLPKPVSKKHGKLITFLRSFMKSRPSKQKLKQRGILRERVFGCDLGEHLLNSGRDVPQVIKSCTEFIEKHGVVDGIYRLSGISSNIQKLRHEFDSEQIPDLTKDTYLQDIHSVGSLCKLYFRELPNPLLTYQLYEKFSEAVSAATDEERLVKIHDVIQQLPPPHYRTLEFLMRHLSRLAAFSYVTNMHCKNLAIVWAPNLLRSKQIESACFSGTSAFMEVRIQSVVVEFILNHVDVLFSPKLSTLIRESTGHSTLSRPKSLLVCSPSTKLLTLEEAQARTQAQLISPVSPSDNKYIEVGEGSAALQGKFHTVIEFPIERRKAPVKAKKSPVGSWRSFFNMGKSSSMAKRKLHRHPSEPNGMKTKPIPGGRGDTGTLRSAKSEESLSSSHLFEGEPKIHRPCRPRSTSDALSSSFNDELLDSRVKRDPRTCPSKENSKDTVVSSSCVPALKSPQNLAGDMHLSPPAPGMASLDFDPLSFRCTIQSNDFCASDCKKTGNGRKSAGSSRESESFIKETSPAQPPDVVPVHPETGDAKQKHSTATLSGKVVSAILAETEKTSSKTAPAVITHDSVPVLEPMPASSTSEMTSPLDNTSTSGIGEEHHVPSHKRSISCGAEIRALNVKDQTEPTESVQRETHREPGAVTFDCTPGLMRSVSLITAKPPVKSAARMLALALAESAHQATLLTHRGSSEPPTPSSPVQHQNPLSTLQWQPPPAFQARTVPVDRDEHNLSSRTFSSPSNIISTESPSESGSPQSTCACHGSESGLSYTDACDTSAVSQSTIMPTFDLSTSRGVEMVQVPEDHLAMKNRVYSTGSRPQGQVDLCDQSETDKMNPSESPVSALCHDKRIPGHHTTENQSAIAAPLYKEAANASNFRTILAEASMPASVQEALPHVPITPPSSYQYSCKEEGALKSSGHAFPNQWSGPISQSTPYHIQPDFVQHQPKVLSKNLYNTMMPRSLHESIKYKNQYKEEVPLPGLHRSRGQRYPPLDGSLVYPTIRRVRSVHAPPEDKLFFFERQPCHSNPYKKQIPTDIHQVRPYFENGKVKYRYSPYSEAPYKDVDPHRGYSHGYSHCYTLRRSTTQPIKMEGSVGGYYNNPSMNKESAFISRDTGPLPRMKGTAQYEAWDSRLSDRHFSQSIRRENVANKRPQVPIVSQPHLMKGRHKCQEIMHSRSKSDSGKDLLISTEDSDGKFRVTMVSHHSPEHPLSEPDVSVRAQSERQVAKSAMLMKQSHSMQNYSQHPQESHNTLRNLTLHKEYSCPDFKHPDPTEDNRLYTHDRSSYRTLSSYRKDDYEAARVKARSHGRSQSVKVRQHSSQAKMSLEPDHRGSFSIQTRRRIHNTMAKPSHFDHLDAFLPVLQSKIPKSSHEGAGIFPNHGCMPLPSHRIYTTGIGQRDFLHAVLWPETEVYAE